MLAFWLAQATVSTVSLLRNAMLSALELISAIHHFNFLYILLQNGGEYVMTELYYTYIHHAYNAHKATYSSLINGLLHFFFFFGLQRYSIANN